MGIKDLLGAVSATGHFAMWLGRTDGTPEFTYAGDELHYSASTMKLPVAIAMMRKVETGELSLDQPVRVHNDFASAAPGERFGVRREEDDAPATWDHLGEQVPLRWLASEMISWSSNLATNLVLELAGVDETQAALAPRGASAIRRGIDDTPAREAGISNELTAADLAAALVAVGNDTAASPVSCGYLRDLLAANHWNGQIPAGLPDGVRVEHKNGWDTGIRHDAGIVRPDDADPFVLVVLTTSELPDDDAQQLIADIAAVAWQHRHDLGTVS
jgi:beta-lactamase class A